MNDSNQVNNVFNFEKLTTYQKALSYIDLVYTLTDKFPQHELYGLTSQFRRAACSIALNTGEGAGSTDKDFNNFLRMAMRSIRECIVCTTISYRRRYISASENDLSRNSLTELSKMNTGLVKSIESKLSNNILKSRGPNY